MTLLHGHSCNFSTTLPNMAAGGKAFGSRSSHGRLSASTAQAWGSSTSDTNWASLLLNLVAKRSIWGQCHLLSSLTHFLAIVSPSLDSLSATTFSQPGMCQALRVTCLLEHQVMILHRRMHRRPDLIPPLCLYRQSLWYLWLSELCCSGRGLGTLLGPRKLPLAPKNLCAVCFLVKTKFPLQCGCLSECPSLLLMHL